jgi:hypothetical protein
MDPSKFTDEVIAEKVKIRPLPQRDTIAQLAQLVGSGLVLPHGVGK